MNTEKTTPELCEALAAAQAEIENATKSSDNPFFKSKYADLAEVLNTVRPVFAKHGLAIIQGTGFDGTLVHVDTVVTHKSGGMISSVASCVPAKHDGQGVGSSTTYLRRYSLAGMTGVAQEDLDGNDSAHKNVAMATESQVGDIRDRVDELGVDKAKFMAHLQVANLEKLTLAQWKKASVSLDKKAKDLAKS